VSDLEAKLRLTADGSQVPGVLAAVEKSLEKLGRTAETVRGQLDRAKSADKRLNTELGETAAKGGVAAGGLDRAAGGAARFERSAGMARSAGLLLGTALATLGAREFATTISDAAFAMQGFGTGFEVTAGSMAGARSEMAFARAEAERLGVPVRDAMKSFVTLSASTMDTAVAGQRTRDVWNGMTEAGLVLHTGTERQNLAMMAMAQIASKGVVSLEDLKNQLAESLPGSLAVAAKAMGVGREELLKLVGSGKVMSDEFIPKFADALHQKFGPAIENALNTPLGRARKAMAETQTAMFDLEVAAGGGFLEGMTEGMTGLNASLTDPAAREAAKALGHDLGEGLATAAHAAAFLVDHIHDVETAITVAVGLGMSKWLVTIAADARVAAIALAQKGAAATAAAGAEGAAANTLAGVVQKAAAAELQAAAAAQKAALAHEEAAVAAMAEVRALNAAAAAATTYAERQAVMVIAEGEVNAARAASLAAAGRMETATMGVTKATGAMAGAGALARGSLIGLVELMGGPLGIGLIAIAGVTWAFVEAERAANEQAQEMYQTHSDLSTVLDDVAQMLADAGVQAGAWHDDLTNAKGPTDDLAVSTDNLADKTLKLADARRQAAIADLQASMAKLKDEEGRLLAKGNLNAALGTPGMIQLFGTQEQKDRARAQAFKDTRTRVQIGVNSEDGRPIYGDRTIADQITANRNLQQKDLDAQAQLRTAPPEKPKPAAPAAPSSKAGKADKLENKAQQAADDLAADQAAQEEYTAAVLKGGAALDEWKIKEAGRQAVEAQGLSNRKNLTSSEQTLLETIRTSAEETERLRLANERVGASATMQRQAELDTQALKDRAEAAALGEQALEDLRIKEAGLAAQQQLGIDTLDQLDEKTRKAAQAAIDAAKAKEAQAIATEKAEKVAAELRGLDVQIAQTEAYVKALQGGEKALVDYTIAEAVRQEVERTGKTLTPEQIAQIKAKTEALYRLKAASEGIADQKAFEEELRLARLTNDERDREVRILDRKRQLLAQNAAYSDAEAEAVSREQIAREASQRRMAEDVGQLKNSLRQAFIDSGEIGFDQVADYAERRLREAIYDALLAKPIDIIVNATVNWLDKGLDAVFSKFMGAVTGSPFTASGGHGAVEIDSSGNALSSAAGSLSSATSDLSQALPLATAAMMAINTLTPMLSRALGFDGRQAAAAKVGGNLFGLVGAAMFGALAGKESNHSATATFGGGWFDLSGNKRDGKTSQAATDAAASILDLQERMRSIGLETSGVLKSIELGGRDPSRVTLADGTIVRSKTGDVQALIDAAGKALLQHGVYDDPQMKRVVDEMIAANRSFEDIAKRLGEYVEAQGFQKDIQLQLLKFTDPRAAALQQLHDEQKARRDQVADYAAKGFYTDAQMASLQTTLDALENAELAAALENLGDAATDAVKALRDAQPRLREWLDKLGFTGAAQLNPGEERQLAMAQYERQLELARAGNSDALGSLTSYADRLLEADQEATSSAMDRLALANKLRADIEALAAQGAPIGATTTATSTGTGAGSSTVVEASAGSPTGVTATATSGDIATLTEAVNGLRADLNRRLDQLGQGMGGLVGGVGEELAAILRRVESGGNAGAEALRQLAGDTRLASLLAAANAARLNQ
jgi:tape measure domain-containing protein